MRKKSHNLFTIFFGIIQAKQTRLVYNEPTKGVNGMNISGISPAGSIAGVASTNIENTGANASVRVLDMAQDVFEDIASMLIESMSSITGIGQNIDMYV